MIWESSIMQSDLCVHREQYPAPILNLMDTECKFDNYGADPWAAETIEVQLLNLTSRGELEGIGKIS